MIVSASCALKCVEWEGVLFHRGRSDDALIDAKRVAFGIVFGELHAIGT